MIKNLIKSFTKLPGVGNKTAQRFAYHLLERNREAGMELAKSLELAMTHVKNCKDCQTLTENDICSICADPDRDNSILCIVETPNDLNLIEESGIFKGKYFVLGGYLSPIDGITPEDLGLDILESKIKESQIIEIILATNATIEGEVTAHFIKNMTKGLNLNVTRIAHGIPIGGELEYADSNTIAHALSDRKNYS
ncbi:MAG: recombination protein RecR [Gammaproteobacteria bacterium]|jgi:recombination protein RecR|nr:recombination protein RecR [Gammaproteobacteria bacterium]